MTLFSGIRQDKHTAEQYKRCTKGKMSNVSCPVYYKSTLTIRDDKIQYNEYWSRLQFNFVELSSAHIYLTHLFIAHFRKSVLSLH